MYHKYARAISDKTERARLHSLYLARNAFFIIGFALLSACLIIAVIASSDDSSDLTPAYVAVLLILLGILISFIVALVLTIKFKRGFDRILAYGAVGGESAEVTSYRAKFREELQAQRKAVFWPTVILVVCVAIGIFLFVASALNENTEADLLYIAGLVFILVGLLVLFLRVIFRQMKRTAEGGTFEQRTSDETAAIDAQQGRVHKYKLAEDKNAQKLDYLFPDESLRNQTEALRKKYMKRLMISILIGCVLSFVIALVFFNGYFFEVRLSGYYMPLLIFGAAVSAFSGNISLLLQIAALEKQQYAELKTDGKYEANLRLFELYRHYDKIWGRTPLYAVGLCFVISLVLAIIFPDELYSIFGILPLVVWLFVNMKSVSRLRLKAKPIEDEIDVRNAAENAEKASLSDSMENE